MLRTLRSRLIVSHILAACDHHPVDESGACIPVGNTILGATTDPGVAG